MGFFLAQHVRAQWARLKASALPCKDGARSDKNYEREKQLQKEA